MNRDILLDLFNKHLRVEITYPGFRRERTSTVIRHVSLEDQTGTLLFSEIGESNADEVIEEQVEYFRQLKQPFEWKVFDYDQPHNLSDKLKSRGFTIEDSEALMMFDLNEDGQLLNVAVTPEIRRITDEQGIWDIVKMEDEVWGGSDQELGKRLAKDLHDDSVDLFIYAAYVNDKVVSAAWMYLHEGTPFASLWGGSTLPLFRKRGYYRALLGVRAREAAKRGYRLLMVDASSMSQPILEKQGFLCLARSTPCMSPTFE